MCPCATHMQSVKASCEAGSRLKLQSVVVCPRCVLLFLKTDTIAATPWPQMCLIYGLFTSGELWNGSLSRSSRPPACRSEKSERPPDPEPKRLDPRQFIQLCGIFGTPLVEISAGSPTRLGTVVTARPVTFWPKRFGFWSPTNHRRRSPCWARTHWHVFMTACKSASLP